MSRITEVRTVALEVADQDRALRFYVDTLGLRIRVDIPVPQLGGRWIEVAPPGAGGSIALIPAGRQAGIRLATTDAIALHAGLDKRGVAVQELLRWPGVPPMFAFTDIDGNVLVAGE
jgi:catechol 2,3-dioxygenase-like lactoylglutathione lyase family enzyme